VASILLFHTAYATYIPHAQYPLRVKTVNDFKLENKNPSIESRINCHYKN